MSLRRVPARLEPLPGESLDSWVVAYSAMIRAPFRDVLVPIGQDGRRMFTPWTLAVRGLAGSDELDVRFGFPAGTLDQLVRPLREYRQHMAKVGRASTRSLVAVLRSSRYCPECLSESGGRWQSSWRYPWNVACSRHETLLATRCPRCAGAQHHRRLPRIDQFDESWRCTNDVSTAAHPERKTCRADLRAVAMRKAPDVVVALCRDFVDRFERASITGEYASAIADLEDLLALVALANREDGRQSAANMRDDTATIANVLSRAAPAVHDPLGPEFADLVSTSNDSIRAMTLPPGWNRVSASLVAQAVNRRLEFARPLDRLRWGNSTNGTRPTGGAQWAHVFADRLPSSLWPGCAMSLMPRNMAATRSDFRRAMIVALLVPGTELSTSELCAIASYTEITASTLSRCLGFADRADPQGTLIPSAIQLSADLREHPPPIDYARRRRLGRTESLLTPDEWEKICQASEFPSGTFRRVRMARLWVWEQLTGGTLREASDVDDDLTSEFEAGYYAFLRGMTPRLYAALTDHATSILERYGAGDEPLSWEPKIASVGSQRATGATLSDALRSSLRDRLPTSESLRDIGHDLGLSIEHLKCVVRSGEFLEDRGRNRRGPAFLAEEELRRLLEVERLTVQKAAERLDVNRKTVSARCAELGIPTNGPNLRRSIRVPDEWLREEYEVEKRPIGSIANELECAETTVARALRASGTPLRARGGGSHASRIRLSPDFPLLLARACRGQAGLQRVHRFVVVARSRSVSDAAKQMGVFQSVLSGQVRRLEQDAGGPLLERPIRPGGSHQLTSMGRRLVRLATDHLDGVDHVEMPPEPLRTALLSLRGRERLALLMAIVECESVEEAVERLATSRESIRAFLRAFESTLGTRLVRRDGAGSSLRPTAGCRTLLRQAATWENTSEAC